MNLWNAAAKRALITSLIAAIPFSLLATIVLVASGVGANFVIVYLVVTVICFLPALVLFSSMRISVKLFVFVGCIIAIPLILAVFVAVFSK